MRRNSKLFLFLILVLLPVSGLYAQDKLVAVVNHEVITQKDLTDFLNFVRLQYSRELQGKDLEDKLDSVKLDLLQRLIEDRLILQQAKLDRVVAEASRVKARIDEIKKRYASDADFEQDLARQGLVRGDLENKINEQILMYNLIEQKVRSKVMVRPEEITTFYNQNKEKFVKPQERMLTLIILAEEELAKNLSYQLRRGEKIEELAGKFMFTVDRLSAVAGQQLRPEIEETVFALGIGEISSPVKVDAQYFIFRLDEIIPSGQLTLAQSQDKIQEYLFETKMQDELSKWLDELKKQSYIKILEN